MFFLFLFIVLIVVIGASLIVLGLISKDLRSFVKTGAIICCIPFGIIIIALFFQGVLGMFKHAPSTAELIGTYKIAEASNLDFDPSSYNNYTLILKSDSTFTLTPTPLIDVCEKGQYEVDYSFELLFRCGNGYTTAHIERRFGDFRIEFIIGDPDSGQSIYFKKIK